MAIEMPRSASAGQRSSFQSFDWRRIRSSARSRMSRSVSCGVRPSGERGAIPDAAWSISPATRTMKNSSRLLDSIEQKFTRSSSGTLGSDASSKTRASKSSRDSSRFRIRSNATDSTVVEGFVVVFGICRVSHTGVLIGADVV